MNFLHIRKIVLPAILAVSLVSHARGQGLYTYLVAPNTQNTGQTTGGALLAQSSSSALVTDPYYTFGGFNDAYALYGGGNNPTAGGVGGTLTYGAASYTSSQFTASSYAAQGVTYVAGSNPTSWAANNSTAAGTTDMEWIAATPNQNNALPGTPPTAPGAQPGIYYYFYTFTVGGVAGTTYAMNIAGTIFADNGVTLSITGSGAPVNGAFNPVTLLSSGANATPSVAGATTSTNRANVNTFNSNSDLNGAKLNYVLTLEGGGTYILTYAVTNLYSTALPYDDETGQNPEGLGVANFAIQYVPEPGAYALWLMAGVLGLALARRIARRNVVAAALAA